MKTILVATVFIALALTTGRGADESIAWGKPNPTDALVVGLSTDALVITSGTLPTLHLYLKNQGTHDIKGIVQWSASTLIVVNGLYYAEGTGAFSAMESWTPPQREYGPIAIALGNVHQFDRLLNPRGFPRDVLQTRKSLRLNNGKNTICVYYFFGDQPPKAAKSGEIVIEVR